MEKWILGAAVAVLTFTGPTMAGSLDTSKLQQVTPPNADHPLDEIISGYEFRTAETKSLQDDDFENPAFLWLETGEEQWSTVDGKAGKSCASCHEDASASMKGVRTQMPKWNAALGKPQTLEQYVNACRETRMEAKPWKWESKEMLGMTAYIGNQSKGMPVSVKVDGEMSPWFEKGKEIYNTRVGQLDLSCASCHAGNYGNYIRADMLSQGQINGFPTYRLKWQKVGSIHRRFKGCMKQVRATPYKVGSDEFIALELFAAYRGQGLPIESPSVRN